MLLCSHGNDNKFLDGFTDAEIWVLASVVAGGDSFGRMFVREVVRNTCHVLALLSSGLNQVLIAVHYQVRDKWRDRGESASGERRGELQVGRAGKIVLCSYLSHFQEGFSSIRNFLCPTNLVFFLNPLC